MEFLMKKLACVVLIMAFFSLSACGGSGESPTEDLLTVAQQEFDYAVSNLTDAQNNLRDEISSAELMLETVTEKDVTDATALGDLRTALDNSKNAFEQAIPEMRSTLEEIQQQQQTISEQADVAWNLYYDLQSAVSKVEESQQERIAIRQANSLQNQTFEKVSPFSEGFAWVQYRDTEGKLMTSVINTYSEIVFTAGENVTAYLPYCDGYAVYLYDADPSQYNSPDNARSCIVDANGHITYDSSADGCRFIFAYGDGNFLALEHVSNFDKDEWSFGIVDKDGKTVGAFEKCDDFNGYPEKLMSGCKYLDEDLFLLENTIYSLKSQSAVYHITNYFKDSTVDFVKGAFHDGRTFIFEEGMLDERFASLTATGECTPLIPDVIDQNVTVMTENNASGYGDGLFFFDRHYYDLDGNSKITFSQYDGRYYRGGTFNDGFAPLLVEGADGLDYFTIINLNGDVIVEPIPGLPSDRFSEGYLVVSTESGCAVYNTSGEKIMESPCTVLSETEVKDGYFVAYPNGVKQAPVFVGIDGSQIGK